MSTRRSHIRVVVPGPPPRKNNRPIVDGRHCTPKRTRTWRARFDRAVADPLRPRYPDSLANRGIWKVEIDVYEARLCHLDVDVPLGDIDSSVTAILDAMQRGRWALLDDDARVVAMTVHKFHSAANPRVEITLTRIG